MFVIKHSMNSLLVSISDVIRVHQKPIQLMMPKHHLETEL